MINDAAPEALARMQTRFAAHIRDPKAVSAPEGIEDRRMEIYRNLFFNNIRTFLSANFPVLKTLYSDDEWAVLCRDFFREYRCHTPLFPELPREFLQYLQNHRQAREDDPPFMFELAHYEWVELALSLDETEFDDTKLNVDGDLLTGTPVLSPLAWPLSYQYPVHRIRPDFQPRSKPANATHLLIWRQRDFSIKFMQLNAISLLLVQKMQENREFSGLDLLKAVADAIDHPNPAAVIEGGRGLLDEFKTKQIVLGTRS